MTDVSGHPAVASLVSYFHEDWLADYSDPSNAFADFAANEPNHAPRLTADVSDLFAEQLSEEELRDYLFNLGFRYRIEAGGWSSHGEWLAAAAAQVADLLAESGEIY